LFLKFLISENIITLLSVNRRNYFHYFQASHNTIINSYLLAATADAAPGFRAGGLTPSFCKAYTPHQGTNTLRKAKKNTKVSCSMPRNSNTHNSGVSSRNKPIAEVNTRRKIPVANLLKWR